VNSHLVQIINETHDEHVRYGAKSFANTLIRAFNLPAGGEMLCHQCRTS